MILNIAKIHRNLVKKLRLDVFVLKVTQKDWKMTTASNKECKCKQWREVNKMERFLKQLQLVKNVTFNSIISMKMLKVIMSILKQVENIRRTVNKLKTEVSVMTGGFCEQTFLGLTGLLWQSLLGQAGFLEYTLLEWSGKRNAMFKSSKEVP